MVEDADNPNENLISKAIFDLLGPYGLNILQKRIDLDPDEDPDVHVPEEYISLETDADAFMEWDMTLGGSLVDAGTDIGLDLGIPGLGLKTEGSILLNIDWELKFGFGISKEEGFYFIIDRDNFINF